MGYNIVLISCGDVKPDGGSLYLDISPETVVVINIALGTKFRETEVISKDFKIDHDLHLISNSE